MAEVKREAEIRALSGGWQGVAEVAEVAEVVYCLRRLNTLTKYKTVDYNGQDSDTNMPAKAQRRITLPVSIWDRLREVSDAECLPVSHLLVEAVRKTYGMPNTAASEVEA